MNFATKIKRIMLKILNYSITYLFYIYKSIIYSFINKNLIIYSERNNNLNVLYTSKIRDIIIFITTLYLFFFILNIYFHNQSNRYIGERIDKIIDADFDRRHPYLVLRELNKVKKTVMSQHPVIYLYRNENFLDNFFPLSGISNVNSLMCNENGYWKTVFTDKYGFNNSYKNFETLEQNLKKNILIIGDSTSEGYCVHDNFLPKFNLEKKGFNVINMAKGGNGPLIEFATLKEYIDIGNFDFIIWAYYPNDLSDLIVEAEDSILKKYLNEDNFKQQIVYKQEKVNDFYRTKSDGYNQYFQFIDEEDVSKLDEKFNDLQKIDYFTQKLNLSKYNFLDLFFLKAMLNDIESRISYIKIKNQHNESYEIFKDIILKSKKLIEAKNSKLLVLYLPSRIEVLNKSPADKKIINILENNEIAYIDLNKEISGKFSYEQVYNYGLDDVHYNEKIYKLISNNLVSYFQKLK